jgi:hypothetical protein
MNQHNMRLTPNQPKTFIATQQLALHCKILLDNTGNIRLNQGEKR